MTSSVSGIFPAADASTEPFWEAGREGRIVIQRCAACGIYAHFPVPRCIACRARGTMGWDEVSGVGRLYSYIKVHKTRVPELLSVVPYIVASIELSEQVGLRVYARVAIEFESDLCIDGFGRLSVTMTNDIPLVYFRPGPASGYRPKA